MHPTIERLRATEMGETVRFREGEYGASSVVWGDWQEAPIYIVKRNKELPRSMRQGNDWQAGAVILFCFDNCLAEFRESDFDENFDCFSGEEKCIQLDFSC